jgi:DNA-binding response OmpR family regulator
MRILIADDDRISRSFLAHSLGGWGYEVIEAADGSAAWPVLEAADAPPLAILDWMMPGREGTEICKMAREREAPIPTYIILLTARSEKEDIVTGLAAGADDYLTKPFDAAELRARLQVGVRLISLQQRLKSKVSELEDALAHVKQLRGLLPMCAWCKKIRNDSNYWQQLEVYISENSEASFSHGICPQCYASMKIRKRDEL